MAGYLEMYKGFSGHQAKVNSSTPPIQVSLLTSFPKILLQDMLHSKSPADLAVILWP